MPDDHVPASETQDLDPRRRLAGWQRLLLVVSILVTVVGGVLMLLSGGGESGDVPSNSADRLPVAGLTASSGTTPEPDDPLDKWSPTVFRLGFSFFVGFAIAYALRSFVKISIITIGIMLLALFGLQYAGIIDVDWSAMESHYETAVTWLKEQTATLAAFVQGYLPSAGMGAFGFATGFRRR